MTRLADYLSHIERAVLDACAFVEGMSKEAFLLDRRTQNAVVMCILVAGEAATKVMERHADFAQQTPQIPWRSMRGMRNRMAHGYFDIDLDVVWATVSQALPALLAELEPLRRQLDAQSDPGG